MQGQWPCGNDRRTLQLNKQHSLSGMESRTKPSKSIPTSSCSVTWSADIVTEIFKSSTKAALQHGHTGFILVTYSVYCFAQPFHCHFFSVENCKTQLCRKCLANESQREPLIMHLASEMRSSYRLEKANAVNCLLNWLWQLDQSSHSPFTGLFLRAFSNRMENSLTSPLSSWSVRESNHSSQVLFTLNN